MNYITWGDLAILAALIFGSIICVYLIMLLRNLNEVIKQCKSALIPNRDNIDETLQNLPVISKNLVHISESMKNNLAAVEAAVTSVSEAAEMAAATAQTIRNDIVGKIIGVVELIDLIKRMFFKDKESNAVKTDYK